SMNAGVTRPARNLYLSRSLVSMMSFPPSIDVQFAGVFGHQLIKKRSLAGSMPKNPSQPLHMLTNAAATRHDDANARIRNIDTLVQHLGGDDDVELAGSKTIEHPSPLRQLRLMSQHRQEKLPADPISHGVVVRKNDDAILVMLFDDAPKL